MIKALPIVRSPDVYLETNASLTRDKAIQAHKAGKSARQICEQWPEVFCLVDGKLGQLYDYVFGSGRWETNRRILD